MKKITILLGTLLFFTGCATNVSLDSALPMGNTSANINSSGQASGNVNVGGVNVSTYN